jgi:hypothetical protein
LYVKKTTPSLIPTDFESSLEYGSLFKACTGLKEKEKEDKKLIRTLIEI